MGTNALLTVLLFAVFFVVNAGHIVEHYIGRAIAGHEINPRLPPKLMYFCPLIAVVAAALFVFLFSLTETDDEIMSEKSIVDIELGGEASLTKSEQQETRASGAPLKPMEERTTAQTPKKKKKKKVSFINNIKIFLTCVVLFHHCVGALVNGETFLGAAMKSESSGWQTRVLLLLENVDRAYFMGLFFFYSGFFTGTSLDKKGIPTFLFERVIRLGIPFTLYIYVFGPLFYSILPAFLTDGSFQWYSIPLNSGPLWFTGQLLFLNTIYAFVCGKGWSPRVPYPNTALLILFGICVGYLTTVLFFLVPGSSADDGDKGFAGVPCFWKQYPSYVLLFFGGVVAQRNNWMDAIKKTSTATRIGVYAVCLVMIAWLFVVTNILTPSFNSEAGGIAWNFFLGTGFYASMWLPLDLAVTYFFMDFVNFTIPGVTDFFAKSMYTAYIIQFLGPMAAAFFATVAVANANNLVGKQLIFTPENNVATYSEDTYVIPMWLLCTVITYIIIWPLAYGIRSIPGFSKVL